MQEGETLYMEEHQGETKGEELMVFDTETRP